MANLRKYKYDGSSNTRPNTSLGKSSGGATQAWPTHAEMLTMDIASIKVDILSSLRKDISSVIREDLTNALADDFESLKREITVVKTENNQQ